MLKNKLPASHDPHPKVIALLVWLNFMVNYIFANKFTIKVDATINTYAREQ